MGHNELVLLQKVVGYGHAFVQQAAGVVTKIQHQPFDVAFPQAAQVIVQFLAGVLAELKDLDIRITRFGPEGLLHAVAPDLFAYHGKRERLVPTLARDDDSYLSAQGALQLTDMIASPGRNPAL